MSQESVGIWLFGLRQILIHWEFEKKYNIKTLYNNEITNNLFSKNHFIAILNHFVVLNCVLLRREQKYRN